MIDFMLAFLLGAWIGASVTIFVVALLEINNDL